VQNPVIYKITSPSERIYIGQSWNWIKRKSVYKRLACREQVLLYNSLIKYGFEQHKVEIINEIFVSVAQAEKEYNLKKNCLAPRLNGLVKNNTNLRFL